jgi:methyltransferase
MRVLYVVLALVAIQRLAELAYANRNTRALLARGASEYASWQHPLFIGLHASWLLSLLFFVPTGQPPNWYLIAVFFALQGLRVWVIATLGAAWTTRIISLPEAPLVRAGPYRLMRHPNYAIVAAEIAVLPLAFGAVKLALIFSVLNAALLAVRIRAEEEALASRYSS